MYSEALKEAYASADVDEPALSTLEFRHSTFVQGGVPYAIRIVSDKVAHDFLLENDAPIEGGKIVTFQPCGFELQLPKIEQDGVPSMQITVANVARILMPYLEQAISSLDKIEVTYRPYLLGSVDGPEMDPVLHMSLTKVHVGTFQITGRATLEDVHNWAFPNRKYTTKDFPGLAR